MGQQRHRAFRPSCECVERRELLSGLLVALGGRPPVPSNLAAEMAGGGGGAGGSGSGSGGGTAGFPSPLLGQGTPTPREQAREAFKAYFSGPVYVAPGRFSDQAQVIYFRGLGGSSQFLHGDFQMAIVIPKDPTAPLTGEAVLEDKNNNSSGIIGLQLHGTTPQAFDRQGRPTQLTFSNDPSIYSGIYFVNTAGGTVSINYSKGSATVRFHGSVYTTGLTNPTRNSDLYSRGGRITPRSGRP